VTDARQQIRLLGQGQETDEPPSGFGRRQVSLPIREEILHVVADLPDRPMRLAEIMPFVYQIDDRLMAMYLRQLDAQRKGIFCRKGCSACCASYLVVLSLPEMYYQMEMLGSLPEPRRRAVRQWLDRMAARARESGLIERLGSVSADEKPLDIIEQWWRRQEHTACPFLLDGACGIYRHRFIACREFYSHSPPATCARRQAARMPLPLSLLNVPWRLEQALSGEPSGSLSLPLMQLWAEVRSAEARRTWPAAEMVERLFGILAEAADEAQRLRGGAVVERPDPSASASGAG
jgi:Fe-S-cluster containining protein